MYDNIKLFLIVLIVLVSFLIFVKGLIDEAVEDRLTRWLAFVGISVLIFLAGGLVLYVSLALIGGAG
jgi:hypothetical protein